MHGDIIRVRENLLQRDNRNLGVKRRLGGVGQIRVIADNVHTQRNSRVCNFPANRAQADNAKLFAHDFRACIGRLALFGCGADIGRTRQGLYPVCALHHLTGSQQQAADHQFLDRVGVCARGVEYNNPLVSTAVERNIVDARARARNAFAVFGENGIVQLRRADKDCVIAVRLLGAMVFCGVKTAGANRGNFIKQLNLIHGWDSF